MWITAEMSLTVKEGTADLWLSSHAHMSYCSNSFANPELWAGMWICTGEGAPIIQQHSKTELYWSSENCIETGVSEIEMASRKESL